jgi:hypothetical protein
MAGRWCAVSTTRWARWPIMGSPRASPGPGAEARAMSHEATNWAIKQRGLKPTTKIVLWHLCDRFNPDYGCFPSQDRLAHDCEISRSTLNEHLGQLEAVGLLRRVPRLDPVHQAADAHPLHSGVRAGLHTAWLWTRVRKPDTGSELRGSLRGYRRLSKTKQLARLPPCPAVSGSSDTGKSGGAVSDFPPTRVRKMPKAVSGIRTLTL